MLTPTQDPNICVLVFSPSFERTCAYIKELQRQHQRLYKFRHVKDPNDILAYPQNTEVVVLPVAVHHHPALAEHLILANGQGRIRLVFEGDPDTAHPDKPIYIFAGSSYEAFEHASARGLPKEAWAMLDPIERIFGISRDTPVTIHFVGTYATRLDLPRLEEFLRVHRPMWTQLRYDLQNRLQGYQTEITGEG